MSYRFFSIPAENGDAQADELNRFLQQHRTAAVEKQLVIESGRAYWAFCVSYLGAGNPRQDANAAGDGTAGVAPKVDYKQRLAPHLFEQYAALRRVRKEIAEQEGTPVYNLFTNEQLARMVEGQVDSLTALGEIEGIGKTRKAKYGERFLRALRDLREEYPPSPAPVSDPDTDLPG